MAESLRATEVDDGELAYELARVYDVATSAAQRDNSLDAEQRKNSVRTYGDAATKLLARTRLP